MTFLGKLGSMLRQGWRSVWSGQNLGNDLEKHISSLEGGLQGLKLQLAKAIQQERGLAARLAEFEELAEACASRALAGLEGGQDESAREALRQKKSHRQNAEAVRPELAEQRKTVQLLQASFRILEARLEEARVQFDLLGSRRQRAEVKLNVSGILEIANQGIDQCNAPGASIEGTVKREVIANATLQLESSNLGDALGLASQEQSVEEELLELKGKIRGA